MSRAMPAALALAAVLAMPAQADTIRESELREGTPVAIVGQVSSPPAGLIGEEKMQVAVGPNRRDYTLHFSDAHLYGPPRRIQVTRLNVVGRDHATLRQSGSSGGRARTQPRVSPSQP